MRPDPEIVDFHQHFLPPGYADALLADGIRPGGLDLPEWSRDAALRYMDRAGIRRAIVSLSTPGVSATDPSVARALARRCNEFAAGLMRRDPDRFGFFATLPLDDVDGSVVELEYALDRLGATGVILLANTRGRYLGDRSFRPLLSELDRRRTLVFVHPGELPASPADGVPGFVADFLLDTTRTALSLILSGALDGHPNIRWILAHAGGFVPYMVNRLIVAMAQSAGAPVGLLGGLSSTVRTRQLLRRFHYDVALSTGPATIAALVEAVGPDRIVFGSDWPFAPESVTNFMRSSLAASVGSDDTLRMAIDSGNARRLLAP